MITLKKAIEIVERTVTGKPGLGNPIVVEATQLCVEAAKKLELDRVTSIHEFEPLLPGEEKGDAPMLLYGTIIGKDVRQWGG